MAVIGDGSAMYSIQALWTAAHLNLPITFVIANNGAYTILKERLIAFSGASVAQETIIGMDFDPPIDFGGLAAAMGMKSHHVDQPGQVADALRAAMAESGPVLLDVAVHDGYRG